MDERYPEQVRAMPQDETATQGGLISNVAIMAKAREHLSGKWGFGALVTFVFILASGIPSALPRVGGLVGLVINGPLALGVALLFLALVRTGEARLETLFDGFKNFAAALITYVLMILFVILWSLLLIVPGIVAALSYALVFYILADNPQCPPRQALARSKELMLGNRWKLFFLGVRFIPWALLCVVTLGIGVLWFFPYLYTSMTVFYEDIKRHTPPAAAR